MKELFVIIFNKFYYKFELNNVSFINYLEIKNIDILA